MLAAMFAGKSIVTRRRVELDERNREQREQREVRWHVETAGKKPGEEGQAGKGDEVRALGVPGYPPENTLKKLGEQREPGLKRA